jgi:cell division protein FtsL
MEVLNVSALELQSPPVTSSPSFGRFRVIDRRPVAPARRSRRSVAHPFRAALICTALPALVLVAYVALWTTAVHGGYQEQRLTRQIQRLHTENQTLSAQVLGLKSTARILNQARLLGMQEPGAAVSVHVPAGIP